MALTTPAMAATALVAVLHLVFFVLESVLWTKPTGRKIFGQTVDEAETTKVLAMNQGVYNAGLAVALAYGLWAGQPHLVAVLLVFIVAMGLFGAIALAVQKRYPRGLADGEEAREQSGGYK